MFRPPVQPGACFREETPYIKWAYEKCSSTFYTSKENSDEIQSSTLERPFNPDRWYDAYFVRRGCTNRHSDTSTRRDRKISRN
jgi:hypothetical protein